MRTVGRVVDVVHDEEAVVAGSNMREGCWTAGSAWECARTTV